MKKIAAAVILFLCLGVSAQADEKIQGWCQDGGYTVDTAGNPVVSSDNTFQRSFTGCTVTVYDTGTVNLSTIYSDNAASAKANPFTAANTGQWFFYAENGRYDVRFSGGGIPVPFTTGDYSAFDESDIWINVRTFGATGDGVTDDAVAIQAAFDSGEGWVYFPCGTYRITTGLSFDVGHRLMGESQKCVVINNEHATQFAFEMETALQGAWYDSEASIVITGFTINSVNGIKINQTYAELGDSFVDLERQGTVHGTEISNNKLIGTYGAGTDPNFDTAVVPTRAELRGFGVGLQLAKHFDGFTTNNYFLAYGIAIDLDYTDVMTIDANRFGNNARSIHVEGGTTATTFLGSGNKIVHNNIVGSYRRGGVYLSQGGNSVSYNSFEGNRIMLQGNDTGNTQVTHNSFSLTTPYATEPLMSFAPSHNLLIAGNNHLFAGETTYSPVEILSTNWEGTWPMVARFVGNTFNMPTPLAPHVIIEDLNPLKLSANNIPTYVFSNTMSSAFPWVISAITGKYVFRTADAPTMHATLHPSDYAARPASTTMAQRQFLLRIHGAKLSGAGELSTTLSYTEGVTVKTIVNKSFFWTSTTLYETKEEFIDITTDWTGAATGLVGTGFFTVQTVHDEVEVASIELIPTVTNLFKRDVPNYLVRFFENLSGASGSGVYHRWTSGAGNFGEVGLIDPFTGDASTNPLFGRFGFKSNRDMMFYTTASTNSFHFRAGATGVPAEDIMIVDGGSAGVAIGIGLTSSSDADLLVKDNRAAQTTSFVVEGGATQVGDMVGYRLNGVGANASGVNVNADFRLQTYLQAALPTATSANGTMVYCSDCNVASACTGGGAGALAYKKLGGWICP